MHASFLHSPFIENRSCEHISVALLQIKQNVQPVRNRLAAFPPSTSSNCSLLKDRDEGCVHSRTRQF